MVLTCSFMVSIALGCMTRKNLDQANAGGSSVSDTTSEMRYAVYESAHSASPKLKDIKSPFYAIQYITQNGTDGWVAKQTDGTPIFQLDRNGRNKFYKFQHTSFHGETDATGAKKWTHDFSASHVVRSDGIFATNTEETKYQPYSHHFTSKLREPEVWALEGNTGAYVYKKSISNKGFRSIDGVVGLSQARMQFDPEGKTRFNAYVYMSSNSNSPKGGLGCDLGLMSAPAHKGDWYLVTSRTPAGDRSEDGLKIFYPNEPLVKSTLKDGVWIPNDDVYMRYSYNHGSVSVYAKNLRTGVVQTGVVKDPRFDHKSPNITLMTGTSFVPDVSGKVVADIKSNAYLKNIVWVDNKIFSDVEGKGAAKAFTANTADTTNYYLIYDTDNVSSISSGNTDIVDIDYSSLYK